jgi:ferric-dicitrate binding protein FerR (iron transport regulator)
MAATLAVVAGATLWQTIPVRERALAGAHRTVVLPDDTRVALNAGSELRYARGFRTPWFRTAPVRTVSLNGEAFFEVRPSDRPFVVRTQSARVTVLGTSFLVRAHDSDGTVTDVAVQSGLVRVESGVTGPGDAAALTLSAGEGATVSGGRVTAVSLEKGGVDRRTMWRRGGIALVDQPLDAIFRELERQYAVDIRLVDVVVGAERLTLYYPERPSLETVLSDLCTRGGLRYRRTSRGYEIMPAAESIPFTR